MISNLTHPKQKIVVVDNIRFSSVALTATLHLHHERFTGVRRKQNEKDFSVIINYELIWRCYAGSMVTRLSDLIDH